jgi:hypothetical protein
MRPAILAQDLLADLRFHGATPAGPCAAEALNTRHNPASSLDGGIPLLSPIGRLCPAATEKV